MTETKKPKTWHPKELYREFARELLANNRGTMETVEVTVKSGKSGSNIRYKTIKRKVQVGGYWGKYNAKGRTRNFWIYTRMRLSTGQWKVVEVMNYHRWLAIMETYFLAAREYIIGGEALNLCNWLGQIEPRHIERNHENRQVNFFETMKQPKVVDPVTGKLKAAVTIFFTEDSYPRIAWRKAKKITNERSYEFIPCHGDSKKQGFKQQFSQANMSNPALKHTYPWYPRQLPVTA